MRRLFATILGLWFVAAPAFAQDTDAIESVISGQLDAFQDRDVDRAWEYAAPNIKSIFGDSGNFGMMVERGYPMVWDNTDVRFMDLREINGNLWQRVMIRDGSGALHFLDYQMIETARGWQITAVQLLPPPDIGA